MANHSRQAARPVDVVLRIGLVIGMAMSVCVGMGGSRQVVHAVGPIAPASLVPELVKDINPLTYPSNPEQFTKIGSRLFFAANDGVHGAELWQTDGTLAQTVMVQDILAGQNGSPPQLLSAWGDKLFFFADDGIHGLEPWMSDGTISGTLMLHDVNVGLGPSRPGSDFNHSGIYDAPHSVAIGDKLIFPAYSGDHGNELWVTDGTVTGTHELIDLSAGGFTSNPHAMVLFKGAVYFLAEGDGGSGLWRTDGTAAGTTFAAPLFPNALKDIWLTATSTHLYFAGDNGFSGLELWRSDGTAVGTGPVADIFVGPSSSLNSLTKMTSMGGNIYFVAENSVGRGLWKSNGTAAGTVNLQYGDVTQLISTGDRLYFVSDGTSVQQALQISDGTPAGTQVLKVLGNLSHSVNVVALYALGETAYVLTKEILSVSASNGLAQFNLWKSDGSVAGTTLVKTGYLSVVSPSANDLVSLGQQIFFAALGEVWRSDGTPAGTALVKDINVQSYDSRPTLLSSTGTQIFFAADDGLHGQELWASDGTDQGTHLVKDISAYSNYPSNPEPVKTMGGDQYFVAVPSSFDWQNFTSGNCLPKQLFRTDGTVTNTVQLTPDSLHLGAESYWHVCNGVVYSFSDPINTNQILFAAARELWRTDGTVSGTVKVADFAASATPGFPVNFRTVNGKVFFRLAYPTYLGVFEAQQLWVSDGTEAGTQLVKKFAETISSDMELDGNLLFSTMTELWSSDGTPIGTTLVHTVTFAPYNKLLVEAGDKVYLTMDESFPVVALWQTDGTPTGTMKLTDLPEFARSSNRLESSLDQLYLVSEATTNYPYNLTQRIWHLNTTTNQFDLIWDGSTDHDFVVSNLSAWQGHTIFASRKHLWTTDGTAAGTYAISDITNDLTGMDQIWFAELNGQLLFQNKGPLGSELYRMGLITDTNVYLQGNPSLYIQPQGAGGTVVFFGNQGLSNTLATTLTATLHPSLTYVSNSLGISPTVNGDQLIWQLPTLGFLERSAINLDIRVPDAPLGTQYPITLTIASEVAEANLSDNTFVLNVQIASMLALPVVIRL